MGQEPFGYFGLGRHSGFAKVTRRSGRNPKWPLPQEWICTRYNGVDCEAVFASKPAPTVESLGRQRDRRRLAGRLRRQASSHNWIAGRQQDSAGWQAVIAGKPAPTIGSRGVSEIGVGGRPSREQAPSPQRRTMPRDSSHPPDSSSQPTESHPQAPPGWPCTLAVAGAGAHAAEN